jgi:hypothetical protein
MLDSHLGTPAFATTSVQCCLCRAEILPSRDKCIANAVIEEMECQVNARTVTTFAVCGLVYYAECSRKMHEKIRRTGLLIASARRLSSLRGSQSKTTFVHRLDRLQQCRRRMESASKSASISSRVLDNYIINSE